MYTGSLIIDAFGNDWSLNPGPFIGIPLINRCNQQPYHAKETLTFFLPAHTHKPAATNIFTIPAYGGAIPTIDTNGDTVPDQVPGCGLTTIAAGQPLYGAGPVDTSGSTGVGCGTPPCTNPRQIFMPEWALRRHMDGTASFEGYGLYLWDVHFADLHNDVGVFSKGGGDGSFTVAHGTYNATRKAVQVAGPNKFGGVMRLLGSYGESEGYLYAGNITSVFYQNWLLDYLGHGGQATAGGVVNAGYTKKHTNYYYTVISGYNGPGPTVYAEVFKWTTGKVTVTAVGGTFPTVLQRTGYDHRTSMGQGAVQLVSPMLTKWVGLSPRGATAAIGIMKLNFAPEPSEWMLLSSGISMLGLMAWRRSRRR